MFMVDEEILALTDEWRDSIARFLSAQSTTVSLSDLGSHVPKPPTLPATVKLLDALQSDPLQRFAISGEGSSMRARRIFRVDDEEIREFVDDWRRHLADYLSTQSSTVGLSDIGSNVARPTRLPTSVKLIDVLRTDPSNRFIITGEGNNIRAKFNFHLNEDEIASLVEQWRESISRFLSTQSTTVGLSDIGSHVARPFCLPNSIKLLETLQSDPQGRFAISGEGSSMRARRIFRVDDDEIIDFVEDWRNSIARYLGAQYTTVSLSDIGSNVSRPPRLPTSVKLIEVMRADPRNRFVLSGDGNNIRAALSTFARSPNSPLHSSVPISADGNFSTLTMPSAHTMAQQQGSSASQWMGDKRLSFGHAEHKTSSSYYPLATPSQGIAYNSSLQPAAKVSASYSLAGNVHRENFPAQSVYSHNQNTGVFLAPQMQSRVWVPSNTSSGQGSQEYISSGLNMQHQQSGHLSGQLQRNSIPAGTPSYVSSQPVLVAVHPGSSNYAPYLNTGGLSMSRSQFASNAAYGSMQDASSLPYGSMSTHRGDVEVRSSTSHGDSRTGFSTFLHPSYQDVGSGGGYLATFSGEGMYVADHGVARKSGVEANSFPLNWSRPETSTVAKDSPDLLLHASEPMPSKPKNGSRGMPSSDTPYMSFDGREAGHGVGSWGSGISRDFIGQHADTSESLFLSGTSGTSPTETSRIGAYLSSSTSDRNGSATSCFDSSFVGLGSSMLQGDLFFGGGTSISTSAQDRNDGPSGAPPGLAPGPVSAPRSPPQQSMSFPLECVCPLSSKLMTDPVTCADGHTYERAAIEEWLVVHGTSPITKAPLSSGALAPNYSIKATIDSFRLRRGGSPPTAEPSANDRDASRGQRQSPPVVTKPQFSFGTNPSVAPFNIFDFTGGLGLDRQAEDKFGSPATTSSSASMDVLGSFELQPKMPHVHLFGEKDTNSLSSGSSSLDGWSDMMDSLENLDYLGRPLNKGSVALKSPIKEVETAVITGPSANYLHAHNSMKDAPSFMDDLGLSGKTAVTSRVSLSGAENVLLSVWLPELFAGFDSALVTNFVTKLTSEGFVTVRDLWEAHTRGQLTLELLRDVADFRLGHFNRLTNGLSTLGV